jgi:Ni/Co efflux regulator RcnB
MKAVSRVLAVSTLTLALTFTSGVAFAQDRPSDQHAQQHHAYVKHEEWKKGAHIRNEDWNRGEQVDWHAHHLRQPPKGYEWREIDGNYVLANPGGVIFSVVIARH